MEIPLDNIFIIGDRVILTSNTYPDKISNPRWNGYFGQIIGSVTHSFTPSINVLTVFVEWDNGAHNSYYPFDLSLYQNMSPPIQFPEDLFIL
jgi:hypothetical protein